MSYRNYRGNNKVTNSGTRSGSSGQRGTSGVQKTATSDYRPPSRLQKPDNNAQKPGIIVKKSATGPERPVSGSPKQGSSAKKAKQSPSTDPGNDLEICWSELDYTKSTTSHYEVIYKAIGDSGYSTIVTENKNCTLPGLKENTAYEIKVRAVLEFGNVEIDPKGKLKFTGNVYVKPGNDHEEHVDQRYEPDEQHARKIQEDIAEGVESVEIYPGPKYERDPGQRTSQPEKVTIKQKLLDSSKRIRSNDNPEIYQLQLKKVLDDEKHSIRKFEFGQSKPGSTEKVVMLVGATGTGKTTLINGMVNYLFGVEWKDKFRFKLISEIGRDGRSNQAKSQTSCITSYTLHHEDGFQIPHTLTIIDTPGFGDTEGMERDRKIVEQVGKFFSTVGPAGIDHIDAVGFVTQSSLPRLTPTQKYIFDSVLNLFGKDIADNIFLFLTFCDGQPPQVMSSIKAARLPYQKFFKFNSSAIYVENRGYEDEDESEFNETFWNMGIKSYKQFFKRLGTIEGKTLVLTKDALNERNQLEVYILGIQLDVQLALNKLDQLKVEQALVRAHKADMNKNKDFTYTVEEEKTEISPVEPGTYTTICVPCKRTCHYPCVYKDDKDKIHCAAMNRNGDCRICPQNCRWNLHRNLDYRYEIRRVKVTKDATELKARYEEAYGKELSAEEIIKEMEEEYEAIQVRVIGQTDNIRKSLERIQDIALRPSPLTTVEYLDILIQSEEGDGNPGWRDRVEQLKAIRKQAKHMQEVADRGGNPMARYEQKVIQEQQENRNGAFSRHLGNLFGQAAKKVISAGQAAKKVMSPWSWFKKE